MIIIAQTRLHLIAEISLGCLISIAFDNIMWNEAKMSNLNGNSILYAIEGRCRYAYAYKSGEYNQFRNISPNVYALKLCLEILCKSKLKK